MQTMTDPMATAVAAYRELARTNAVSEYAWTTVAAMLAAAATEPGLSPGRATQLIDYSIDAANRAEWIRARWTV
jgi:hypothetical protein